MRAADLVAAYAAGYFPMDDGGPEPYFERPAVRCVIPLDAAAVERWRGSRSTAHRRFTYSQDTAFEDVLHGCAAPRGDGLPTFLTPRVLDMYRILHAAGVAHSFEAWDGDTLAAGVLTVMLGRACMCESTFHRRSGAGSAVMVAVFAHLVEHGYELCDVQQPSNIAVRFAGELISGDEYLRRLHAALRAV